MHDAIAEHMYPIMDTEVSALLRQYHQTFPEILIRLQFVYRRHANENVPWRYIDQDVRYLNEVTHIRHALKTSTEGYKPTVRDVVVYACALAQENPRINVVITPIWDGFNEQYYAYQQELKKIRYDASMVLYLDEILTAWNSDIARMKKKIFDKAVYERRVR